METNMEPQKVEKVEKKKPRLRPKHLRFIKLWLDPNSETFSNVYQSAVAAGFAKSYARTLTTQANQPDWMIEAKKQMNIFEPEHIYKGFQEIARNGKKDSDKLKALELMGKAKGMFIDRVQQDVQVKFVNDVPRPETERVIIDADNN